MKVIIQKSTLTVVSEEFAQSLYPNTGLDFSPEGLEGTDLTVVETDPQPTPDHRYYDVVMGAVKFENNAYSVGWDEVVKPLPIQELYDLKIKELNDDCRASISTYFYSDALGSVHRYTSDRDDQMNIQGNVLDAQLGMDCPHYCYLEDGTGRDFRIHTPDQMIQVGRALKAHVIANLVKCNTYKLAVAAALDANDARTLVNIVWE